MDYQEEPEEPVDEPEVDELPDSSDMYGYEDDDDNDEAALDDILKIKENGG